MCWIAEDIAKYFLYVSNLILFLLSTAVLGLSIWILVDKPSFLGVLSQGNIDFPVYTTAAVILLVVSILVILITFFGCCGAQQDSRCMLATYFLLILLLLIGLAIGAFMAFSGKMDTLKKPFIDSLTKYDDQSAITTDKALVEAWDSFQLDFECCGVDSFADWSKYNLNFRPFRSSNMMSFQTSTQRPGYPQRGQNNDVGRFRDLNYRKVPKSCCDPNKDQANCQISASSIFGLRAGGCFTRVVDEINKHSGIVGGIAIGVVVVMVLNALISLYMCTCGHMADSARRRTYGRAATRE